MNSIKYFFLRITLSTGLYFYFIKITVQGLENIPKKGGVLFTSNHQNAMIDPMLVGACNRRTTFFLTRASAFKNKLASYILRAFHLIPIYRFRDGYSTLRGNQNTFASCVQILKNKNAILIFPEGNHNLERRIRPLTKGFVKILKNTFEEQPDKTIYIVPVGLNYEDGANYPTRVTLCFGEAIMVNKYFNNDKDDEKETTRLLINKVQKGLVKLTTHIPESEYGEVLSELIAKRVDFQDPKTINRWIEDKKIDLNYKSNKPGLLRRCIYPFFLINTVFPLIIWRKIVKPTIDEEEFIATFRFAVGLITIPLFYGVQTLMVNHFFGNLIALLYILVSLMLLWITTKLK